MTQSGIELATFRFVTQHPNHCTTAVLQQYVVRTSNFAPNTILINRHLYEYMQTISNLYDVQLRLFCRVKILESNNVQLLTVSR